MKARDQGGGAVEAAPAEGGTLRDARRRFERSYILSALARHDWSVPATARSLGLQRPNLYRKARQLSIPLKPPGDDR